MYKVFNPFFYKNNAVVDHFEIGQRVDHLVLILDMNLESVMVIGEIDQAVTFIYGPDGIKRTNLILMQVDDLQSEEVAKVDFIGYFGDVVVREVQFDQVDTFAEEIKMLIEEVIAC